MDNPLPSPEVIASLLGRSLAVSAEPPAVTPSERQFDVAFWACFRHAPSGRIVEIGIDEETALVMAQNMGFMTRFDPSNAGTRRERITVRWRRSPWRRNGYPQPDIDFFLGMAWDRLTTLVMLPYVVTSGPLDDVEGWELSDTGRGSGQCETAPRFHVSLTSFPRLSVRVGEPCS